MEDTTTGDAGAAADPRGPRAPQAPRDAGDPRGPRDSEPTVLTLRDDADGDGSRRAGLSEFVRLLGVEYDEVTAARVTGEYDADARHHQPMGIVHGGVHTAVIEQTASTGAYLAVRDRGLVAVGVANVCDFIRPHRAGRLRIVAEPVHVGATSQLWHAEVTRVTDGALVARGQVRLANISLRDASPE